MRNYMATYICSLLTGGFDNSDYVATVKGKFS